jgi:perosamine synthetase
MTDKVSKVDDWIIPLYKIYTDDEDLQLISKVIRRGTQWALGPEIEELEKEIASYVNSDYCITVNSGTSALHATYLAYEIGNFDEILIPSFSFISTANSVLFVNAKPVFCDIEESTLGLDYTLLAKKITSKTKAIVPMDYGGLPCNILKLKEFAEKNNLLLIEDAAEALGSSIQGKKIGSISDSSIFSFCGNKVLTTGEGGAITTNSKSIYEKLKLIRSHGRIDSKNYFENPNESTYLNPGYNWRMSSITAALGLTQLKKLDKLISLRQKNAKNIINKISKFDLKIITGPTNSDHIFQIFSIRLKNKEIRDNLHNFLIKKRIFSKIYFLPIHLNSFYMNKFNTTNGMLPITELISSQILTIPIYPNMTNEEINYLVDSISEFFDSYMEK